MKSVLLKAFAAFAALAGGSACADPVADFYKGKSITHIVGAGAGGAYDLVSRAVVSHMGKHIPGTPNFIVSHMAGASSLAMMNYLTNPARKDGTAMGMTNPNIALELPLKMLSKGGGRVLFDVSSCGRYVATPHHDASSGAAHSIRVFDLVTGQLETEVAVPKDAFPNAVAL